MNKLRILLISNMYPGERHVSFGAFIKNIEEGLVQNGADVSKIVIKDRGESILSKVWKYIRFYWQIFTADLSKYDFVQVSYPSHTFLPFLFRSTPSRLIVRLHGHDLLPKGRMAPMWLWFTRRATKKAMLVVVPSNYFFGVLQCKVDHVKDHYIYPSGGIDTRKFYPVDVPKNKFTVGFVGWLIHGKGPDILLKALARLPSEIEFEAIFIGEGNQKALLMEYANQHGLHDRVKFLGGVRNEVLVDQYNKFDVFVFPTRELESFGNVAIEAMACGIPVIGSEHAGLTDYILNGQNGYFFTPGSADDLALKIEKYYRLSGPEKDAMRVSAIKTAMRYEKNTVTRGFMEKLAKLREMDFAAN